MRDPYHPARDDISLPTVLYALSDPVRLRMVRAMAESGEKACGTFGIPLAKATVSHHIKVLRDAGVIWTRHEGTLHLNTLRRDDLEARFPGLLDAILNATAEPRQWAVGSRQ
jgi:DNA-binding transcriptional ArsR family regulator